MWHVDVFCLTSQNVNKCVHFNKNIEMWRAGGGILKRLPLQTLFKVPVSFNVWKSDRMISWMNRKVTSVDHLPKVIWAIGKAVTSRMVQPGGEYREGSYFVLINPVVHIACLVFFCSYLPAINILALSKLHKQFPAKFPAILTDNRLHWSEEKEMLHHQQVHRPTVLDTYQESPASRSEHSFMR